MKDTTFMKIQISIAMFGLAVVIAAHVAAIHFSWNRHPLTTLPRLVHDPLAKKVDLDVFALKMMIGLIATSFSSFCILAYFLIKVFTSFFKTQTPIVDKLAMSIFFNTFLGVGLSVWFLVAGLTDKNLRYFNLNPNTQKDPLALAPAVALIAVSIPFYVLTPIFYVLAVETKLNKEVKSVRKRNANLGHNGKV